jgi:hypothetical protein
MPQLVIGRYKKYGTYNLNLGTHIIKWEKNSAIPTQKIPQKVANLKKNIYYRI